jgi:hypothetical protein
MRIPRSAAVAAASLLGGLTGLAVATGAAPGTASFLLASHDDGPGDISGPCDEAEHAADPRCARGGPGTTRTSTTTPGGASTTSTTTAGAAVGTAPAGAETRTVDAAAAGTVTYAVDGASLTLLDATPVAGWSVEVEQAVGREIEVDFRSGTQRVQVNVELEDGQVRERVRLRDDFDDSETRIENGQVVRHEPGDDDHDDNSGPGSDDDDSDDDNSGPGSGDDD